MKFIHAEDESEPDEMSDEQLEALYDDRHLLTTNYEPSSRGRGSLAGERRHAKLDPETVSKAKQMRRDGMSWRKIGECFGVSDGAMRKAVLGITWKGVQ